MASVRTGPARGSAVGDHPLGGLYVRLVQCIGTAQMAHPLGALLGQYMPPVGGIPLEGSGGIAMEALGRPAIGFDFRHLFSPVSPFFYRIIMSP